MGTAWAPLWHQEQEEGQLPGQYKAHQIPPGAVGRPERLLGMFDVSFHQFVHPTEPASISERLSKCRGIKLLVYNGPQNAFWQLYGLSQAGEGAGKV